MLLPQCIADNLREMSPSGVEARQSVIDDARDGDLPCIRHDMRAATAAAAICMKR